MSVHDAPLSASTLSRLIGINSRDPLYDINSTEQITPSDAHRVLALVIPMVGPVQSVLHVRLDGRALPLSGNSVRQTDNEKPKRRKNQLYSRQDVGPLIILGPVNNDFWGEIVLLDRLSRGSNDIHENSRVRGVSIGNT